MLETLLSLLAILHVAFRGNSTVYTTPTDNKLKLSHRVSARGKAYRSVALVCHQMRHSVVYDKWYMPNQIHYSYVVEIVAVDGKTYSGGKVGHYPHLCAQWLHHTTYPHACAVNAHLDHVAAMIDP